MKRRALSGTHANDNGEGTVNMQLKPTLETDRLILRPMDPERDLDAVSEAYSDAETMRFLGGKTMDRAQTWRSIAMMVGHHAARGSRQQLGQSVSEYLD
ncbi:MAG: GNAT family N-acetyltransferase [Bacteroidota bacterium]